MKTSQPTNRNKIRKNMLSLILCFSASKTYSCINCNGEVRQAINSSFWDHPLLLLGFIVLAVVVVVLSLIALHEPDPYKKSFSNFLHSSKAPLASTGMVLGIGVGGFIDGIVLHQILQWHEMLSNKITPSNLINKSTNMFWDGIFHFFTLLITICGIWLLWKVLKRRYIAKSAQLLIGGMLSGWGIFNLLEGILNHHILKLHNIREISQNQELWNYGFLLFSLLLLLVGLWQMYRVRPSTEFDMN